MKVLKLNWIGAALAENENVTVTINGEDEFDAQVFITNDIGAQSIILSKNQLENVGEGEGIIFMDRRYQPELIEKTEAGGVIIGRYRPENIRPVFE